MSDVDLPSGWVVARIEDVGHVQLGRQRSPENHAGTHMRPYLRVANVFEDRIDTRDVMEMNFAPDEFERFVLSHGDILLNEGQSKEWVGRSAVYKGEVDGACFTNSLVRFRPHAGVEVGYSQALFKHYVRNRTFQGIAQITTNIAHLGKERFAQLDFPLPPTREQKRIVAKIEALQARSDAAKEALDAIPPLLEKFRQSVLAAAFRGDLTKAWREAHPDVEPASALLARIRAERRRRWEEANPKKKYVEPEPVDTEGLPELPGGWCWASLDEVSSALRPICYGVVQPGEDSEGGVPLVRVCDIYDGVLHEGSLRTISQALSHEYGRSALQGGEVLVTVVGTIGRVAIVPSAMSGANIARAVARIVPADQIGSMWIHLALQTPRLQDALVRESREVARKTLNISSLNQVALPIAPELEADRITSTVAELLSFQGQLQRQALKVAEPLGSLTQSILAKAFRGEFVPQDPSDEPASVLLERIRRERDAEPPPARKRRGAS